MLSKTIAKEVGPYGIRCNCLVPGAIETQLMADWLQRTADEQGVSLEQRREAWFSNVPLKAKISTAEDVAKAALFLASEESRQITGSVLTVDGGFSAR